MAVPPVLRAGTRRAVFMRAVVKYGRCDMSEVASILAKYGVSPATIPLKGPATPLLEVLEQACHVGQRCVERRQILRLRVRASLRLGRARIEDRLIWRNQRIALFGPVIAMDRRERRRVYKLAWAQPIAGPKGPLP